MTSRGFASMRLSTSFAALPVLLLVATGACAQDTPTICIGAAAADPDTCSDAVGNANAQDKQAAKAAVLQDVTVAMNKEATRLNTGPSGMALAGGAATTNDYIPFIQALLGYSPGTEDSADNLGVEFSNFLPIPDTV